MQRLHLNGNELRPAELASISKALEENARKPLPDRSVKTAVVLEPTPAEPPPSTAEVEREAGNAGGEPAEDASATSAAQAAEAEASFEAQLQSRFPAAHGTDEQRAAAERLARLHAGWCREWRKPPPR